MFVLYRGQPPDYVLKEAKNTNKFFKCVATISTEDSAQVPMSRQSAFQALTEEEYEVVSVSVYFHDDIYDYNLSFTCHCLPFQQTFLIFTLLVMFITHS